MFPELSSHIFDIAQNSVRAKASLIVIRVSVSSSQDLLSIEISDNGKGMTSEELSRVTDPFFTTRTTRRIGLGVPFFQMAAKHCGGTFSITSAPDQGTSTKATFVLSHIDRMPLGDLAGTVHTLITFYPETDFLYDYTCDGRSFHADTREFREILGNISFGEPEVSQFLLSYLTEHQKEADQGMLI
jgi:hypothetical protein